MGRAERNRLAKMARAANGRVAPGESARELALYESLVARGYASMEIVWARPVGDRYDSWPVFTITRPGRDALR